MRLICFNVSVVGQTTHFRFRGETSYGFISRVLSTLFGGIVGMTMWWVTSICFHTCSEHSTERLAMISRYISAGNGSGNPYSLAAVAAVCFPPFCFARLYFPGPTMTIVIFFFTSQLVLGYSWQDTHLPPLSTAGKGFDVAWVRLNQIITGV